MKKLKFILPRQKYVRTFTQGLEEVKKEPKKPYTLPWESELRHLKNKDSFSAYLLKKNNDRKGINLEKGHVPQTVYWVMTGNKFIGILKIRHKLWKDKRASHIGYGVIPSERNKGYATEMLRWGIKKAKIMGIKKIIVGCDAKNIASIRVIEKNNGRLFKRLVEKGRAKLVFYIK